MQKLASFTFVHPDYFESLARFQPEPTYRDLVREHLPDGWEMEHRDIWWMVFPPEATVPSQGFKIHLSATPVNAEELIRRAVQECCGEEAPFKVVADVNLLSIVQSKTYGRGSANKFITVYPPERKVFLRLVDTLHHRTRDLESAYILSDRRYEDSKVVFYRYGGFEPRYRVNVSGTREPVIYDADGNALVDERHPFFQLPEWVEDPFGNRDVEDAGDTTLAGRYEIQEPLSFSNAGGVYRATDTRSDRTVIVKEARPCTASWVRGELFLDAVGILDKEHRLLERLQHLDFLPEAIDRFEEWEHHFRVEEQVEGTPLRNYRARDEFSLLPFSGEKETTLRFCRQFRTFALRLLDMVEELHRHDVLVGDLSPGNVLLDEETFELRLIDLESALDRNDEDSVEKFSRLWSTPGYRAPGRMRRTHLEEEDDLYALGMLLFSLMIPVVALFELSPDSKLRFLDKIERSTGLPRQVRRTIFSLLDGDAEGARRELEEWSVEPSVDAAQGIRRETDLDGVAARLPQAIDGMADYLLATWDAERDDRLWPSDYQVFLTNPLSIAYGAAGTALFLHHARGGLPSAVEEWLLRRAADPELREEMPPGFYLGLSGVAYALLELGHREAALDVLDAAYESPLLHDSPDLFFGVAGWGLASLLVHARTGAERPWRQAVAAGEHLLSVSEVRDEGLAWPSTMHDKVHYGIAYGASGVALFLLYLHRATGEERFLTAARRGIDFDFAAGREAEDGMLKWPRHEGGTVVEPYWLYGSAGIGSALVRFHRDLGEGRYLDMARAAGESAFTRFTVLPGLLRGLSSIGELMLDLHRETGDEVWHRRGLEIADSVLCYRIDRPEGLAFPGRYLLRISDGYAYGSAGVGLFFHRLVHGGRRLLHDPLSRDALTRAA